MEPTPDRFGLERFRDVAIPEDFVLEYLTGEGEWIDWGRFQESAFDRSENGAYLCSGHGGSPMWIRCLRQEGMVVYVVDGQGDPYTYRLVPYPSHQYWPAGEPRPRPEGDGLRYDESGDPYLTWEDVERHVASPGAR